MEKLNNNLIGGKAKGLGFLDSMNYNTPKWISLDITHFNEFLSNVSKFDLDKFYSHTQWNDHLVKDLDKINNCLNNSDLSSKTKEYVKLKFNELGGKYGVAIRSSMLVEDGNNFSFAGIFNTHLFVKSYEECLKAIKSIWMSTFSIHSIKYALKNKINLNKLKMGIIIQVMINPEYSGILFTKDPLTGENKFIVSWIKGTGDKLVSGQEVGELLIFDPNNKRDQVAPIFPIYKLINYFFSSITFTWTVK